MHHFRQLSKEDREMLLKFPAYVTLLAANSAQGLEKSEKNEALKFAHIKTFTSHPLLRDFYQEVDQHFKRDIETLDAELPKEKDQREQVIRKGLIAIEMILGKLDEEYGLVMHKSMQSFKEHVSKAHHNVLESFVFPVPIKGLTS